MKRCTEYYATYRWNVNQDSLNPVTIIAPLDMASRWDVTEVFTYRKHVLTSLLLLPPLRCDLCGADLRDGDWVIGKRTHAAHLLTAYQVDDALPGLFAGKN